MVSTQSSVGEHSPQSPLGTFDAGTKKAGGGRFRDWYKFNHARHVDVWIECWATSAATAGIPIMSRV